MFPWRKLHTVTQDTVCSGRYSGGCICLYNLSSQSGFHFWAILCRFHPVKVWWAGLQYFISLHLAVVFRSLSTLLGSCHICRSSYDHFRSPFTWLCLSSNYYDKSLLQSSLYSNQWVANQKNSSAASSASISFANLDVKMDIDKLHVCINLCETRVSNDLLLLTHCNGGNIVNLLIWCKTFHTPACAGAKRRHVL
jgi:hypothetical protein